MNRFFSVLVLFSLFLLMGSQPPALAGGQRAETDAAPLTIQTDKTALQNGGTVTVTGAAPAGASVCLEIRSEETVRASRFDTEPDKETGKRPYILYMTHEMPAHYRIYVPEGKKEELLKIEQEGKKWSYSKALTELGATATYSAPATITIERYQASLLGSIIGSRGKELNPMDEKENRKRSMQLVKARFKEPLKVFATGVKVNPDGRYTAEVTIPSGSAPGKYSIVAVTESGQKSLPAVLENRISFPVLYLSTAGTSVNLLGPFFFTMAVTIFGVLMGAGGGFILNPLLVSIWPLPHTIVAGTVMPTILFSQATGITRYSKIKFISWKLGVTVGLAMLAGGFIGPKLTEMITLDQFKFVFGWILLVLAALMFWQTTPGYLARNKKEQEILRQFQKKEETASAGKGN